jgi:hypothetical protein
MPSVSGALPSVSGALPSRLWCAAERLWCAAERLWRAAAAPGAKVLVIENVLSDAGEDPRGHTLDVSLLVRVVEVSLNPSTVTNGGRRTPGPSRFPESEQPGRLVHARG